MARDPAAIGEADGAMYERRLSERFPMRHVLLSGLVALALACTPVAPSAPDGGEDAGDPLARPDAGEGEPDAGGPDLDDAGSTDAGAGETDAGTVVDAGPEDAGNPDAGAPDDGGEPDASTPETCEPPDDLGRGLRFVRENPMMISGLAVVMGDPTADDVDAYFDAFHANTVHLWENGLPAEVSAWSAAGRDDFRYVSWVHRDGTSVANGEVLGGLVPALPGRVGYQIGDEPTDQAALDAIAAGALAVQEADPDGLRIINLNDTDGAYTLREQAIGLEAIDVLSYDHYNWGWDAYEGLADTRRVALAAGKPYWRYVKAFHYKDESAEGTLSDLRWDAFVGAVYGFTGYTWFVYSIDAANDSVAPLLFEVGGDYGAARTPLYAAAATVNLELARLGRALVMLTSTDVRYVPRYALSKPQGIAAWSAGAGGDPHLTGISLDDDREALVGFFVDDCGERYVMLQNQAHDGASLLNRSESPASFTLGFDFAGAPPGLDPSQLEALDLETGAIVDLSLAGTGTTRTLTTTLPAGGVLLFKYKTGAPFALQAQP